MKKAREKKEEKGEKKKTKMKQKGRGGGEEGMRQPGHRCIDQWLGQKGSKGYCVDTVGDQIDKTESD